ncbi:MAG: hypothetical protein ACFFCM_10375 [Promethearchaeota archaeon]
MALDLLGYLNIICAIIGILLFTYCISIVLKILKLFPKAKMTRDWKIINILIIFFLIGYAINILAVILELSPILIIMQAFVYAFGALFVLIVVRLSYKTYKILIEAAESKT